MRRTTASRARRVEFDDDGDDNADDDDKNDENGDEEHLFPAGGPTSRPSDAPHKQSTKQRRRRQRLAKQGDGESDADVEAARAQRAHARQRAEAAKRHKIKSDLFVHESDDEEDMERDTAFFALEESRRRGFGRQVDVVLGKRASLVEEQDAAPSEQRDEERESNNELSRKRRRSKGRFNLDSDSNDDDNEDFTANQKDSGAPQLDDENDIAMLSESSAVSQQDLDNRKKKSTNSKRRRISHTKKAADDAYSTAESYRPIVDAVRNGNSDDDDDDSVNNTDFSAIASNVSNSTTPLSSQGIDDTNHIYSHQEYQRKEASSKAEVGDDNDSRTTHKGKEALSRTRNVRAGFIIDSDSE